MKRKDKLNETNHLRNLFKENNDLYLSANVICKFLCAGFSLKTEIWKKCRIKKKNMEYLFCEMLVLFFLFKCYLFVSSKLKIYKFAVQFDPWRLNIRCRLKYFNGWYCILSDRFLGLTNIENYYRLLTYTISYCVAVFPFLLLSSFYRQHRLHMK